VAASGLKLLAPPAVSRGRCPQGTRWQRSSELPRTTGLRPNQERFFYRKSKKKIAAAPRQKWEKWTVSLDQGRQSSPLLEQNIQIAAEKSFGKLLSSFFKFRQKRRVEFSVFRNTFPLVFPLGAGRTYLRLPAPFLFQKKKPMHQSTPLLNKLKR